MGLTKTLSLASFEECQHASSTPDAQRTPQTYLFKSLCIEQDPSQLNNLCRVLCDIYAVLVGCRRDCNNDIAVDVLALARGRRTHCGQEKGMFV